MASRSASRFSDLDAEERLVVALVRGVHGLRGVVRVEVLTDRPEDRFRPGIVLRAEGSEGLLTIATAAPVADGPGWRLTFREVPDRTAAEALRGVYLEAALDPAGVLGRGEYFWHEVIGCTVRDADGSELGAVHDLYRVAQTEVMVIRGGPHGEFDVPIIRSLVRVFAPRRGEIVVDGEALDLGAAPAPRDDDAPRPRAPRRVTRKPKPSAASAASNPTEATQATDADPSGTPEA